MKRDDLQCVDLGDAIAKDVMVPRVNVTFADIDSSYDELINLFREDKFTRLPVYQETKDNVVGTINMKDLLLYDSKKSEFQIKDILREAYFTYEYKTISSFLLKCARPLSISQLSWMNTVNIRSDHPGRYP